MIRKGNGNRPFFILLSVVVLSFQQSYFLPAVMLLASAAVPC